MRFEAEMISNALKRVPNLRLRMFVTALPLEHEEDDNTESPLHLCGWLVLYYTDQIDPKEASSLSALSSTINDAPQTSNTIRSKSILSFRLLLFIFDLQLKPTTLD